MAWFWQMAGTMTCFTKRLIAGLGTAWLALIILACTEDASETTVSGDFATGGGCRFDSDAKR